MPILYSVISRDTIILAKYASCPGNFDEVIEQILIKIPAEDNKLTLSHSNYLFHYVTENGIVYLCITDDEFFRTRAFLFLADVKKKFEASYGKSRINTAIGYAMNIEFSPTLRNLMAYYSDSKEVDKLSRVQNELDELSKIVVKNIENLTNRGEQLELLITKTDNLSSSSVGFRNQSRHLQRSLFWKNMKIYFILGAIAVVVIYLLMSTFCGGLHLPKCV